MRVHGVRPAAGQAARAGRVARGIALSGPYPLPGDDIMLLCDHCRDDWVHGEWDPPFNNFQIVSCVKV